MKFRKMIVAARIAETVSTVLAVGAFMVLGVAMESETTVVAILGTIAAALIGTAIFFHKTDGYIIQMAKREEFLERKNSKEWIRAVRERRRLENREIRKVARMAKAF